VNFISVCHSSRHLKAEGHASLAHVIFFFLFFRGFRPHCLAFLHLNWMRDFFAGAGMIMKWMVCLFWLGHIMRSGAKFEGREKFVEIIWVIGNVSGFFNLKTTHKFSIACKLSEMNCTASKPIHPHVSMC
jgi:hypothetical protein